VIASGRQTRRLDVECAARAQIELSAPDSMTKAPLDRSFA
jgi:hypothetical protein